MMQRQQLIADRVFGARHVGPRDNRDQKWFRVKHHEEIVGVQEDVYFLVSGELFGLFLYTIVIDGHLTIEIMWVSRKRA